MADGSTAEHIDDLPALLWKLREYCNKHGISAARVAQLLHASLTSTRRWLDPGYEPIGINRAYVEAIAELIGSPPPIDGSLLLNLFKAKLKETGASTTQVAELTGASTSQIWYWLTHGVQRLSLENIRRIQKFLHEPLPAAFVPRGQLVRNRPSKTIDVRRLSKRFLENESINNPYPKDIKRPETRGDCLEGEGAIRPCPWVSCKHNLYLDVEKHGSIKINHPERQPWEMRHSCALDIADKHGKTLEEVGEIMNLTRERVRQLENKILRKIRDNFAAKELADERE